jgi:hypothetical protein
MRRVGTALVCMECGADSDQLATRWRAYRVADDEGDELEAEILVFCPHCAEREFGPFGRADSGEPPPSATA